MNILLSFLNLLEMQCFLWFAVLPFFEPQMERLRLVVIFSWKEHGHRESGISQ